MVNFIKTFTDIGRVEAQVTLRHLSSETVRATFIAYGYSAKLSYCQGASELALSKRSF
jgi:hypothetical protein